MTNVDRCDGQLLTNDSKQRGAAIMGIEEIAKLIRRYAEIEHLYLSDQQYRLSTDLDAAIVKLYSQILEYEARAACHFDRRVAIQTVRNIVGVDPCWGLSGSRQRIAKYSPRSSTQKIEESEWKE